MNGSFIKCDSGYNAFIPNPLPPQISWNESILNAVLAKLICC